LATPQIIAAGGALLSPDHGNLKLARYVLEATGKPKPRICFVPTASGEDTVVVAAFFETYAPFGLETAVLRFFKRTPADLRAFLFEFDIVQIGGGNTRSMLAVWKHWGFDTVLREAWERGIVLCGSSAGSICWFEEGVTDSVAVNLGAMQCLGFLAGSNCPHYDGEKDRRPSYHRLVAAGEIGPGIACDDNAAVHYHGTELHAAVAGLQAARAYRVERAGTDARETALDTRVL
jgi:dipeptidase E